MFLSDNVRCAGNAFRAVARKDLFRPTYYKMIIRPGIVNQQFVRCFISNGMASIVGYASRTIFKVFRLIKLQKGTRRVPYRADYKATCFALAVFC